MTSVVQVGYIGKKHLDGVCHVQVLHLGYIHVQRLEEVALSQNADASLYIYIYIYIYIERERESPLDEMVIIGSLYPKFYLLD